MKLKYLAVLALLGSAPCVAQSVPPEVMEPYRAYTAAVQAGDAEAAMQQARLAFEAGEAAGVDAATLAILAFNYARSVDATGDFAQSAVLLARAARLYEAAGEPALGVLQVDRQATEALFRSGARDEAAERADALADMLERMTASAERDFELGRLRAIAAHIAWNQGRHAQSGSRAREAFAALLASDVELSGDAALLAFYSGVDRAFAHSYEEAAYWFAVAGRLFEVSGSQSNTGRIAAAWGLYARGRLADYELRRVVVRLGEEGWVEPPCLVECGEEDEAADASVEDENDRDARPLVRRAPRYPRSMAMNGVQGIALMQFDVSADGRPENIEVVFSAPHPDFGVEGVRAIEGWTYEPKLVDGIPTRREGVVTQLLYQLED